jgi:hypothetical protein
MGCSTMVGVGTRSCGAAPSARHTRLRPDRLASYMAASAAATTEDGSVAGSHTATPAENV